MELRRKPTKHKQDCLFCGHAMVKGELQVRYAYQQWIYISYSYAHPECAMIKALTDGQFLQHYHKRYGDLNPTSFDTIAKSGRWKQWVAGYIAIPFKLYDSIQSEKNVGKEWLEELFNKMAFDRLFN